MMKKINYTNLLRMYYLTVIIFLLFHVGLPPKLQNFYVIYLMIIKRRKNIMIKVKTDLLGILEN